MKKAYLPNIITIFRLFLAIPMFFMLTTQQYQAAFYVLIIAGISDGIDGFLARHFSWKSKFGAMLDPIADKLLMLVLYSALTWDAIIPVWLLVLVVSRDTIILVGALAYHYYIEEPRFRASLISKINTCLQILLILIVLYSEAFNKMAYPWIIGLMYVVALTTFVSLIDYVITWGSKALLSRRARLT